MSEQKSMTKILRILALVVVIAICVALLFRGQVASLIKHEQASHAVGAQSGGKSGERKVVYWYDAMNPQHTYNKPGKAPDGMDLVPKYAEDEPPAASTSNESSASTKPGERKILFWYDPMHPAYKADKPGIAPDCGMQLVPKYAEDGNMANMPAGTVKIAADKQQMMGVRTATVERKPLEREIHTTAQIVADEARIAHVHVKTSGFIEKIYVDFVGQLVKKGQPLFTLYSPDLVSTEEEYLIAKRGEKALGGAPYQEVSQGAQSLLRSARERLRLWDITDAQIKKLDETGEVEKTMTFYSPISGFVTDRKAFPGTSITPDMELYTLSDLSTVWATADIYEYEVPYVRLGQRVNLSLSYYPGKTYSGRISFLYPTVDPQTRTVKARIEIANPHFALKPQMFADAQIKVDYGTKLIVPQEAVLNSGMEQIVFVVHDGGVFEPRIVTVGPVVNGSVVILSGLKEGETIITSGNFLIDSESKLKSATDGMKH
jgi:multidrug efflux pump subunit AcrA (membrane-fusion protein)